MISILLTVVVIIGAAFFGKSGISSSLHPGGSGYLRSPGGGDVVVLRTQSAFNDFVQASTVHDTTGATEIFLKEGFFVPSGTGALVLESDNQGGLRVRILDGKSATDSGWVPEGWVTKE